MLKYLQQFIVIYTIWISSALSADYIDFKDATYLYNFRYPSSWVKQDGTNAGASFEAQGPNGIKAYVQISATDTDFLKKAQTNPEGHLRFLRKHCDPSAELIDTGTITIAGETGSFMIHDISNKGNQRIRCVQYFVSKNGFNYYIKMFFPVSERSVAEPVINEIISTLKFDC